MGEDIKRSKIKEFIRFFHEMGQLKRVKHTGFKVIGCADSQVGSVADHSWRTAVIAFVLAKMEKYDDPYRVVTIAVFHDMLETRIGDLHKIASMYVKRDKKQILRDQVKDMGDVGSAIYDLASVCDYAEGDVAGIIARDADILETAVSAKELYDLGYEPAKRWVDFAKNRLKTKSAKQLLEKLYDTYESFLWWDELESKFEAD